MDLEKLDPNQYVVTLDNETAGWRVRMVKDVPDTEHIHLVMDGSDKEAEFFGWLPGRDDED